MAYSRSKEAEEPKPAKNTRFRNPKKLQSVKDFVEKVFQKHGYDLKQKIPATKFYDLLWPYMYFLDYQGWYNKEGYVDAKKWNEQEISLNQFILRMARCKIRYIKEVV